MFQAQQLVFYSCISPVHMGAGSAVGVIDNPPQACRPAVVMLTVTPCLHDIASSLRRPGAQARR